MPYDNGTWTLDDKSAEIRGFASFNRNPHFCIDVPDGPSTISLRTSDGRRLTIALQPYRDGGAPECADIAFHDSGTSKETASGTVMPTFDVILDPGARHAYDTRSNRHSDTRPKPVICCVLMERAE